MPRAKMFVMNYAVLLAFTLRQPVDIALTT